MDNIRIVRIVRLQSGEDIIADYSEDDLDKSVLLLNPMSMIFKRLPTGKAVMLMCPWLPLELVDNTLAKIYWKDILSVFLPKEKIILYYNDTVIEVEKEMLMYGDESFESGDYYGDDDGEDNDDLDDELDMEQSITEQQVTKKYIH